MNFNKRISFISLFLIMTMLFNVNVVAFEKAPNNTDEAMSSVASHIYNNCVFYNGDILSNKNFSLTDGLTVFYGENIDPSAIIDKYDSAKVIDTESKSTETPISSNNKISNDIVIMDGEAVAVDETDSNTYLMMVYKNNDRVDIKTIEVMYERNVDYTNILSFIESDLTESRKTIM